MIETPVLTSHASQDLCYARAFHSSSIPKLNHGARNVAAVSAGSLGGLDRFLAFSFNFQHALGMFGALAVQFQLILGVGDAGLIHFDG